MDSSVKYRTFAQNKLVRDKTMSRLEPVGSKFEFKKLNDIEFLEQLKLKLLEESQEVCNAASKEAIISELADVLEVMIAWCDLYGFSLEDVFAVQRKKFEQRGGFDDRLYLIAAAHPEDSPCVQYCLDDPEKYPEILSDSKK